MEAMTALPLALPRPRRGPRTIATGLLIVMAGLFVLAKLNESQHFAWGYLRAFAEAGMVGGLADWFAVTAIFRRPLGLPIPHTAVIPRSQGRIADSLGAFIADNFLSPDLVAERLASRDLAGGLARQLSEPQVADRIAEAAIAAAPRLLNLLDDAAVAGFLQRQLSAGAAGGRGPAFAGKALALVADSGAHQTLVDAGLREAWRALEANQAAIRARVRSRSGWLGRLVGLDSKAADALIGALADTLRAVAYDRDHPLRAQATAAVHRLADDLQTSPAVRAKLESAFEDALAHPALQSFFHDVWAHLKTSIRAAAEDPDRSLAKGLSRAIQQIGEGLSKDPAAQAAINAHLRALASALAERHGRDVANIVSETIRGWDVHTMVGKLEQSVGDDLQYVRINGALIGGLVGLALHSVSLALG
ncbi:MAG: DUF445 family protein [Alphaproteobacteria bacterium]|nr:DUF445 family protein [Alphaproteobacteria bacterium]